MRTESYASPEAHKRASLPRQAGQTQRYLKGDVVPNELSHRKGSEGLGSGHGEAIAPAWTLQAGQAGEGGTVIALLSLAKQCSEGN